MSARLPDAERLRLDLMRSCVTAADTVEHAAGELYGCVLRLRFIANLLEALPDEPLDMTSRIEFFEYHADAYYAAAYRIRDLVRRLTPHPIPDAARERGVVLCSLLLPICNERNERVHRWSANVVAVIGEAPYHPADLLADVKRLDPRIARSVHKRMAREFARLSGGVHRELNTVVGATAAFLDALDTTS